MEDVQMVLIVGLGNPDKKYEKTRHNIGFQVIDKMAEKYHIDVKDKKFKGLVGTGMIDGVKVMLLKPTTYMNRSGESVIEALNFYKLDPQLQMVAVYDDITLAPGNIRVRKKGSAGGHNGIKNIIAHTGTQNFMRVRVGVGEKPQGWDLADYVMGVLDGEDKERVEEAKLDAIEAVSLMIHDEIDKAMNDYNVKKY